MSATEKDDGRATVPSTLSRHSVTPPACNRANSGPNGSTSFAKRFLGKRVWAELACH